MNYKNIDTYLLYLFMLLIPIFFVSQVAFSIVFVFIILIIKAVKITISGKISISSGTFDVPILFILLTYVISTLVSNSSKMNAIVDPATTSLIFFGALIYYVINQINLNEKNNIIYFIFTGVVIYSILILLSVSKVITWFTPIGGYLASVIYIFTLLPTIINVIYIQKEFAYKFLTTISLLIILFSLSISIFSILPKKDFSPKYPSFKISAEIALETIKNRPLFGIGSANYLEAFNKYRSFDYNKTDIWSYKFNQGSSFLLTNITEVGILGFISFVILILSFINLSIKAIFVKPWSIITVAFIFLSLFLFPSFPILILNLFMMLGLVSESKKYDYIIPSRISAIFITIPIIILLFLAGNKIYFISLAEYKYILATKYLKENKAKETYDQLQISIKINPKYDKYHRVLSSLNFGIANALSKKTDLDDKSKEQATIFIQESINEAKAAVAINNRSSENWELLGKTYHLLIPLTNGADKFAIDSYKESVALDPINPILRIKLGEVYMLQKDYQKAIETFKLAIIAKEDHPNSHFNLGLAYKENGDINKAKSEFIKTLSLTNTDSNDYQMVKKEIEKLESQE